MLGPHPSIAAWSNLANCKFEPFWFPQTPTSEPQKPLYNKAIVRVETCESCVIRSMMTWSFSRQNVASHVQLPPNIEERQTVTVFRQSSGWHWAERQTVQFNLAVWWARSIETVVGRPVAKFSNLFRKLFLWHTDIHTTKQTKSAICYLIVNRQRYRVYQVHYRFE